MDIQETRDKIVDIAKTTSWSPRHEFSVFNQMDHSFYDQRHEEFLYKYRVFYALCKVLQPKTLTELGTCAGSAIDAYAAGSDGLEFYAGYDVFPVLDHEDLGAGWDTYERAQALLKVLNLKSELFRGNLRETKSIKGADLIIVDAGHTYRDAYRDLCLALKADPAPRYVFFDDDDDLE